MLVVRGRPPRRAAGNHRRDQRPSCIGQICIVELVGIDGNWHHATMICYPQTTFQTSSEGIDLEIDGLIFRANAGVASFHFRPSSRSLDGVQFTHLARINRTLFFETSISDR